MIKYFYDRCIKIKNKKIRSLFYKGSKFIINIFYPIIHIHDKKQGIDSEGNIIVSLTTFPDRINTVWVTILTIMNQTLKPKKIILWLAEEQFPDYKLPKRLTKLCSRGLEIKYCDDIKPHKKYFYSMVEYPNDTIVTVDDDMFYPEDTLEKLWEASLTHKHTIICTVSHQFSYNQDFHFNPYNNWSNDILPNSSLQAVPIGCGGILYPPNSLDKEVFQKEKIMDFSLLNDDLWLKCMSLKKGTKCFNCSKVQLNYFNNMFTQRRGLYKTNTQGENRNDVVWKQLMEKYKEVEKLLVEDYRKETF